MTRRGLLAGLGAMLAAPAIIRTPGLLMPVRPIEQVWIGVDWASGPSSSVTWTAQATGNFEFKVLAMLGDGTEIDITDWLPLRLGQILSEGV